MPELSFSFTTTHLNVNMWNTEVYLLINIGIITMKIKDLVGKKK